MSQMTCFRQEDNILRGSEKLLKIKVFSSVGSRKHWITVKTLNKRVKA